MTGNFRPESTRSRGACGTVSAILMALIAASGCGGGDDGPARFPIEGKVTLDGQALPEGKITFLPVAPLKGPAASGVIRNGEYKLGSADGPIAGKHRVEIESTINPGFAIDDEAAYAKAHSERRGQVLPPNPVPARYNRQSTLTADVQPDGDRKHDFSLETGAAPASR